MEIMDSVVAWAAELQSLAQAGLFYGKDVFDRERYERIREIAAEMMAERTGIEIRQIRDLFCGDTGYQTPKVDTRAAIFIDGKILLVRERSGKWSMPGGWCEFNLSPVENTVKESKEEAGLDVRVRRLIAVQDRAKHNEPLYAYGVVKMFFLCDALGGEFTPNAETLESALFDRDALPDLAGEKCTREQVWMCFDAAENENWQAEFD